MPRITIEQLFDELRARNKAAADAQAADPVWQAKEAKRLKDQAEQIEREIAAGLRDEDGEWIETEDDEEEEEEEEEE